MCGVTCDVVATKEENTPTRHAILAQPLIGYWCSMPRRLRADEVMQNVGTPPYRPAPPLICRKTDPMELAETEIKQGNDRVLTYQEFLEAELFRDLSEAEIRSLGSRRVKQESNSALTYQDFAETELEDWNDCVFCVNYFL